MTGFWQLLAGFALGFGWGALWWWGRARLAQQERQRALDGLAEAQRVMAMADEHLKLLHHALLCMVARDKGH